MKIADKTVEVQSNMKFDESVAVTIDESAVSMVIERLISAYANPYRAALREYTSNAYDEHVASGQSAPVEVSLPSTLSPVLKVQDFGRGLTRSELKGFGTIGKSTKRDSNEFTGGFGMGSKSALAASSQFTVVSIKNGKRNTVVVARDEHNVPHMNFLPEAGTTDPSGTTIIVPISDISKFGDLTDFFVGWAPGSILVDGEEPLRSVYNTNHFKPVAGGAAFSDKQNVSSGRENVRILINQVYYILNYRDLDLSHKQWDLFKYYIIKVDNGSVDIAPSREDLLYNARTKAALSARFDEILSVASQDLAQAVRDAPTIQEALRLREDMKSHGFPVEGIKWQGRGLVLPGEIIKGNRVPNTEGTWVNPSRDSSTKSGYRVEKTWGAINRRNVWRDAGPYNRFVIVHSAGAPTTYGTYNNRHAHREAFGVAEYLQGVQADRQHHWDFFITTTPLNRINRNYRDLADSVISAEEFNVVVSKVRAEIRAQEKTDSDAKKGNRKLKVLMSTDYYGGSSREFEAKTLKDEFDHVVVLRNQIGGLETIIRDTLTTKKYYNSARVGSINELRKKYKVAIVLTTKHEDLSEYQSVLPPITTFEELALKELKASIKEKSKLERMAARDREKFNIHSIVNIKDSYLSQIKKKATREWVAAVRDYRDNSSATQNKYSWMSGYSKAIRAFMDGIDSVDAKKNLPESPMKRYPLLENVSSYSTPIAAITEYINAMDSIKA